jgi:hypothetical protein
MSIKLFGGIGRGSCVKAEHFGTGALGQGVTVPFNAKSQGRRRTGIPTFYEQNAQRWAPASWLVAIGKSVDFRIDSGSTFSLWRMA